MNDSDTCGLLETCAPVDAALARAASAKGIAPCVLPFCRLYDALSGRREAIAGKRLRDLAPTNGRFSVSIH